MKVHNGVSLIKWPKKLKHIKRMDNDFYISDVVQEFPYVENDGWNLV